MSAFALILRSAQDDGLRVGGLGLVERWQRSLADHGVTDIRVVDAAELSKQLSAAGGPVIIAWSRWVAEHLAIEHFVEHASSVEDNELRSLALEGEAELMPVVVVGAAVARKLAGATEGGAAENGAAAERGGATFESANALVESVRTRSLATITETTRSEGYRRRIDDAATARRASFGLLERLRWRPGGIVAKYLNRPISIRFSYLLLDTRVTPNQTTWAAFVIGAIGVVFVFRGGYWNTILGTALLQVNSIVDGIDGELARVRHQVSSYGAYLDSVCDEILNTALMYAVGYNLSVFVHPGNWLYLGFGLFAGSVSFAYALAHWHCKVKHGLGFYWWFEAYKPRREVQRSTSFWSYFKKLTMKESFLLLFLLGAIFQFLEVMLWVFAIVSVGVVVLLTIHIPIKRARW